MSTHRFPAISSLSLFRRVSWLVLLIIVLLYPGHGREQTYNLTPGAPKVQAAATISTLSFPLMDSSTPPESSARAVYIFEPTTGTVLYSKNARERLPMASTTKIMTALVALDIYTPETLLTVYTADNAVGHTMKLLPQDKLTVKDLLYGLLVSSGNDAALALAENYPGGDYRDFITRMNQKAAALGLTDTRFTNASGLDDVGHYSSVRDLTLIAKKLLENDILRQIVATKKITVTSAADNQYVLTNTNQLLGTLPGVLGLKTGWTPIAGECLVTYTVRDGHELITAILGSSNRFADSENLIDWVYTHTVWQ